MSKRTKTRQGHANPTSERNRRKERHSLHEWGVVAMPWGSNPDDRTPRNKKRRHWIRQHAVRKVIAGLY